MKKVLLMLLASMSIIGLCGCGISNKVEVSKIDGNKDFIYDAEYTYAGLEGKSYISKTMETEYSLEDIVLPYINIDSQDAIDVNEEIEELFNKYASYFKAELEDTQTWYNISNYKSYINGNVLSVVITTESGGTAPEVYKYYTYNFDLATGKKLSYADVYKKAGFKSNNVDSKVEEAIKKYELFESCREYEAYKGETDEYISRSIENYIDSVENDTVQCFIDSNEKLCVIVILELPIEGGTFATIIPIK